VELLCRVVSSSKTCQSAVGGYTVEPIVAKCSEVMRVGVDPTPFMSLSRQPLYKYAAVFHYRHTSYFVYIPVNIPPPIVGDMVVLNRGGRRNQQWVYW
jgi:hypothetical protein